MTNAQKVAWLLNAPYTTLRTRWLEGDPEWTAGTLGMLLERLMNARRPAVDPYHEVEDYEEDDRVGDFSE